MMVFNLQALTRMKLMLSLIELLDIKVNQTITSGCGAVAAHRQCEPITLSSENLVKRIGFAGMLHSCDKRRMKITRSYTCTCVAGKWYGDRSLTSSCMIPMQRFGLT
jgi:hypothetical protein